MPVFEALTVPMKEITFPGPTFVDAEDEDKFFGRLYSLPGYLNVVGMLRKLTLSLEEPIGEDCAKELREIFQKWGIDEDVLQFQES